MGTAQVSLRKRRSWMLSAPGQRNTRHCLQALKIRFATRRIKEFAASSWEKGQRSSEGLRSVVVIVTGTSGRRDVFLTAITGAVIVQHKAFKAFVCSLVINNNP